MKPVVRHRVEYINLTSIIHKVTKDGQEQRDLIEALSHSDFCFGTNAYSLIELSAICLIWETNGYGEYAGELLVTFGPYVLINLEG